jgi:thioredoxin-related protein
MLLRRRPPSDDDEFMFTTGLPAGAQASQRVDPITGQPYAKPSGAWKFAALSFAALLFVLAFRGSWDSPRVFSKLSLEQAATRASEQSKALVLSFSSKLDDTCKRMERETWRHDSVTRALSDRAVVIKLSPDALSTQEKAAVEAFVITRVPTVVVIYNNRELARAEGYQSPDQLVAWFERSLADVAPATQVSNLR